jgi:hypothetical protein
MLPLPWQFLAAWLASWIGPVTIAPLVGAESNALATVNR